MNQNFTLSTLNILDNLPGIIFWKSTRLEYLGANKKFLDLIGVENIGQLLGKKDSDIDWQKDYKDYFSQGDENIIASGKPILSIQKNLVASDGELVTVVTDKYPIYDDERNIAGVLAISSAVYDQQSDSQTYLQNVIEIIPYFIFWKDIHSVYQGCNKKFARLVGKTPSEVVGKTDFDLNWGEGEAAAYQAGDRGTMSGSPTINAEEILTRPDGSKIIMLVNKVSLLDKMGNCIGVLGTSTDITEFKNTQYKLKEAQERLTGIRALSASIAHELRTPLTAIQFGLSGTKAYLPKLVNAYNLAKENNLPIEPIQSSNLQTLSTMFDNIESEVRYSETIINMILMNVKQEKISNANFSIFSMNESIQEALHRYPFKPTEKELVVWENKENFLYFGDKNLMMHLLFNLLKNALYYIQAAKKGVIRIWSEKNKNSHSLCVEDTGKGISEEAFPYVFEKFYTTTYHGTGLGLAFCKMVMNSFDGDIICTSRDGEFTRFQMVFPKVNA